MSDGVEKCRFCALRIGRSDSGRWVHEAPRDSMLFCHRGSTMATPAEGAAMVGSERAVRGPESPLSGLGGPGA